MATQEPQNASADVDMADLPDTAATNTAAAPNGKRKADTELERTAKKNSPERSTVEETDDTATAAAETRATQDGATEDAATAQPLSKNQLKRLRRQQQWDEYKEDRRAKRKDKRHERQARKRAEKEAKIAEAEAAGIDPATVLQQKEPWRPRPVPVAFVIDCDFESYMREQELVSLSSQLVRSYAMNRKAKFQAALHFSSWKGKLKERFETKLKSTHQNWRNVGFHEGDFCAAAKAAHEQMTGPDGGEMLDLIRPSEDEQGTSLDTSNPGTDPTVEAEPEAEDVDRSVVYLTSESPYTLDRLEANTSYIIGGIVDRNREKGLCYKRAREYKVRTAKLPIGEYMAMQSRFVLTTNQVVEIMAKWLECGDWGKAFMDVIPRRKGGTLKGDGSEAGGLEGRDDEAADDGTGEAAPEEAEPSPEGATGLDRETTAVQQQDVH